MVSNPEYQNGATNCEIAARNTTGSSTSSTSATGTKETEDNSGEAEGKT